MALENAVLASADVGLIGLATMGQNLALNMVDHGLRVAVYNRTVTATAELVAAHPQSGTISGGELVPTHTLSELVRSIKRPRRIVILVKAGAATDQVIAALVPQLDPGDLIIDAGNAHFADTIRREQALTAQGLYFIGSGVSGGALGARFGPALMPGGSREAWELLRPIWTAIAAKVDDQTGLPLAGAVPGRPVRGGVPCTAYLGPGGAGHYVKMVHNGIEYGSLQVICESYAILRHSLGRSLEEIAACMKTWSQGDFGSFLLEVTAEVLQQHDPVTGGPLVDVVLDRAGQKETGKWTSVNALELGVAAPSMTEAVFAREISSQKAQRMVASQLLAGPTETDHALEISGDDVRDALFAATVCCYAQGFALYTRASASYRWDLDLAEIARIFRGGCIIRARFMQAIAAAFARDPGLDNLLLAPYFARHVGRTQTSWRRVVARAALEGIPVPVLSSALSYYDGVRSETLPANLLQAQRDYFGAHTYERIDAPRGETFHLDWTDPARPQRRATRRDGRG